LFYQSGTLVNSTQQTYVPNAQRPVRIGAGATDGPADFFFDGVIDEVLIFNRSLSSTEVGALFNASVNQYSNNFTSLSDGAHTFTAYAVDTAANRNQTELRTVTVDTTSPSVFDLIPTSGSNFNVSDVIEIAANVTDLLSNVSVVLANITLPNSTVNQLTLSNALGDKFNNTFTIPTLIGQYNITFIANDTSNNINASETTFFVGQDVTLPNVFDLIPISNSTFNVSDVIEISANVTDNVQVDTVLANITFPNSTIQQLTLNNSLGDAKFNNSFTLPALLGQYNVTFIANDTSNKNFINDSIKKEISRSISSPSTNTNRTLRIRNICLLGTVN